MNSPTNSEIKSITRVLSYMSTRGPKTVAQIASALKITRAESRAAAAALHASKRFAYSNGYYRAVHPASAHKRLPRLARVGIRAANTPRRKSVPIPSMTSEDFIRAGGKIEVLPPAAYVAPSIQPVGWAA